MLDCHIEYIFHPMKGNMSHGIHFPRVKELFATTEHSLSDVALSIRELNRIAYGMNHWALTASHRRNRATLSKLANLVDQLDLLDDQCVFELGYNCPTQLQRYHDSFKETIKIAYLNGMDQRSLAIAESAHERLWQVKNEVTLLFEGF